MCQCFAYSDANRGNFGLDELSIFGWVSGIRGLPSACEVRFVAAENCPESRGFQVGKYPLRVVHGDVFGAVNYW